ncbi:DUF7537 family lipoprotein [Halorussus lipolyticus]|uniref:DUF7537 family lipoprotein n=1 Tax=Halorussus lipolyticus TaxID=3034024 RepID=UPI0023E819AC|nr:hypothetical protein [Halorussus sp. DT80]
MRRNAVLPICVCVLVVLAGCNALPGSGQPEVEATTEEQPETTTGGPSPIEDALPRGLSASGVTDASEFAAAHEEALAGQSYTYDREVRVVADDGTELGRWSQHTQVGSDRLRFNHTQTGTGVSVAGVAIDDTRIYTNGSVTFWNASVYNRGYRRQSGRGFAENTFNSEQLLADVLNASETTVSAVERDGEGSYRVRAASDAETFTYNAPNGTVELNATNITATALVASSGLVRTVTYEFDFVRGNVSGHRTMTVRYSDIGATEVGVPGWVAAAKRVTGETRQTLADGLAPGLNESGVTDAAALSSAHANYLRNRSYTVVSNLTARDLDGAVRARADRVRKVAHDPLSVVSRSNVTGEPRRIGLYRYDMAVWSSQNDTWYAIERPNGTTYQRAGDDRRPPLASRTGRDSLFVLFSGLNTTLADTEDRGGTARYRVNSTGIRSPDALASQLRADSVRNVSFSALVGDTGLVHEYAIEYTAVRGDNTTRIERTVRFTALGETTVERPAWVDEAENETESETTGQ